MKKLLITATAALACVAAFAQGRITFENDALHLVYFTTDTANLLPLDRPLAGMPTPATGVPQSTLSGKILTAELWGGVTSDNLSLEATAPMVTDAGFDGTITSVNFTSPDLPKGVAAFFRVEVYDVAAGSYQAASHTNGMYFGETSIFTTVPSSSAGSYNSIVNPGGFAKSTWANGTQNEDASVWGPGARGAIAIQVANVPEPTTIALAGLGMASLMIFRRRK